MTVARDEDWKKTIQIMILISSYIFLLAAPSVSISRKPAAPSRAAAAPIDLSWPLLRAQNRVVTGRVGAGGDSLVRPWVLTGCPSIHSYDGDPFVFTSHITVNTPGKYCVGCL